MLDTVGLVDAVRQHADLLNSRATDGFHVSVTGDPLPDLPAAVEVAAYRILMEALTNTVRHAGAHHCDVAVVRDGGLHLTLRDDGTGLPPSSMGVGLASMRDRAEERVGPTVTFTEGVGTTVQALLPLDDGPGRPT